MTGKPTKGKWIREDGSANVVEERPNPLGRHLVIAQAVLEDRPFDELFANADLIAAAGSAAHELCEAGYDGLEAVKALPEMLGLLRETGCRILQGESVDAQQRIDALLARLTKKDETDDAA